MVKAIFKDLVIAAAGPNEHKIEDLKSWAALRKGRFTEKMDGDVTHLLCTDEQFKNRKKNERIKEAHKRGKKAVHVVHIDWFTFSCTDNRKLPFKDYNFKATMEKEQEKLKQQQEEERRIRAQMLQAYWIDPDLYHVYTDKKHFRHEVQLFRTLRNEDGALHEKYELYLFESHAMPRLYWFGVKLYQKKDDGIWRSRGVDRSSPTPDVFIPQFDKFKAFFRLKTGYGWRERVLKAGTGGETDFSYTPPTRGKPVGTNLTVFYTYDESVRFNVELRLAWAELFDDELPADFKAEVAMKGILEEDAVNRAGASAGATGGGPDGMCMDVVQDESSFAMLIPDGTVQQEDCEMMDSDGGGQGELGSHSADESQQTVSEDDEMEGGEMEI
ncbi:hypothetical protein CkaCkLH20_05063 [Colletotrichum karsti]|uniref:BRCT domain-containing protein n=1 Tax=Colletotrichum karsti TaxID=1095194 RepID=A0A9P6LL35_9PEZI|nr:uncharacterized protein CkaCkLH20_05063 [Colletotrichum karsti]KAF9877363.1 hypothetical protein CkaCkLH20_05063 [Colletotrichum karsti]